MAWGKNREEALIKPYLDQIDMLKEHITRLENQNAHLVDSLMAAKSPEAYQDMRTDRLYTQSVEDLSPEEHKRRDLEAKTVNKYLNDLESPLFTDPWDFDNYLRSKVGPPDPEETQPDSIHDNAES